MSSKTALVARREFTENLRTKAFWIGILLVPVLIVLVVAVPIWLEKAKDARTYAVIDESGWLLEAIDRRAAMPDLEKVFEAAVEDFGDDPKAFARYPEEVRAFARVLAGDPTLLAELDSAGGELPAAMRRTTAAQIEKLAADEDLREQAIRAYASLIAAEPGTLGGQALGMLPEAVRNDLVAARERIRDWWNALPAEEAEQFGSRLSKARYIRVDAEGGIEAMNEAVQQGRLFAYFVIGPDPLAGNEGFRYVSKNVTDDELRDWFSGLASAEVRERRIAAAEIPEETAQLIQMPVVFDAKMMTASGEETEVTKEIQLKNMAPAAFVYLLWLAVFSISQMLLTNTIEEKSNRILEVLLSSVSPVQLMVGKILGIAATGLVMVASWVVCFVVTVKFVPPLLGASGDPFGLLSIASDPVYLASFVAYFVLGYLLFASLLVGIGSVCNSLKEAGNLQMPVTLLLIVPLLAMIPIARDPNGTLAKVMSYIPPFTPFVMMNRAAGPPSLLEYAITSVLLVVTIALVMWGAAKVFRIGVLMTGKPPTPGEILRWLRAPVGAVPLRPEETPAPPAKV